MSAQDLHDRIRGCIVGGAIGDAIGGPYEGQRGPVQFGEHFDLAISDDTQLTLATCESVSQTQAPSPENIAANFARWFQERRITGIGSSTLKALRDLEAGQHWALSGAKGEMAAGNGAAMRVAPLAFVLNPDSANDRRTLREICRITHQNEEAYVGALAVVLSVRSIAIEGRSPANLVSHLLVSLPDSRVRDRLHEINELPAQTSVLTVGQQFGCSGYVVDSVPVALFAAQAAGSVPFHELIYNAISPGGDTDTIASIAGQIAGSAIGLSQIPDDLLEKVSDIGTIKTAADHYSRMVAGPE